jgi:hypothetical protein
MSWGSWPIFSLILQLKCICRALVVLRQLAGEKRRIHGEGVIIEHRGGDCGWKDTGAVRKTTKVVVEDSEDKPRSQILDLNVYFWPTTVFDRSFEHYGSFEHFRFPQSFAISPKFFGAPQLFINALHEKIMFLPKKFILELRSERIGRK